MNPITKEYILSPGFSAYFNVNNPDSKYDYLR